MEIFTGKFQCQEADVRLKESIEEFALKLMHQKMIFSVYGMFPFTNLFVAEVSGNNFTASINFIIIHPFLFQNISAIVFNVIILMQFESIYSAP